MEIKRELKKQRFRRLRKNSSFSNKNYAAMTILEIVIYMAVFSLVFLSIIGFLFSFEDGIVDAQQRFQVTIYEQFLSDHITNSIRKSDSVNLAQSTLDNDTGVLQIVYDENPTDIEAKYELINGVVYYNEIGNDPVEITPASMDVSKLRFIRINDDEGNVIGVRVEGEYTYDNLEKDYAIELNLLLDQR